MIKNKKKEKNKRWISLIGELKSSRMYFKILEMKDESQKSCNKLKKLQRESLQFFGIGLICICVKINYLMPVKDYLKVVGRMIHRP